MQRLQSHLDHFRRLDDLAQSDSFIHRLHPAIKLVTTLVFLVAVASYSKYEVSGLFPLILYPVALISLGRLPVAYFAERLLFLVPFVVLLAIANPFFDRTVLLEWGGVGISGGWISFVSILLRFMLAVTAVLALVATTGIHDICSVLMRAGIPQILVMQILLLYRYLSLLLEEAYRIEQAYFMRSAGRGRGIAYKAWGSLAGGLLIRTFARAQKIYEAMLCRGFTGELRLLRPAKFTVGSALYLLLWSLFIVSVRMINVPFYMGKLFQGVFG
jgi:cobalt/nickel transport system permease protein